MEVFNGLQHVRLFDPKLCAVQEGCQYNGSIHILIFFGEVYRFQFQIFYFCFLFNYFLLMLDKKKKL